VKRGLGASLLGALLLAAHALADLPPSDVMMPGSQPPEIVSGLSLTQPNIVPLLHSDTGTDHCSSCHVSANPDHSQEILALWRGSMMANASRDPLLWAALAVAEQDFHGAGDTCIRCHVSKGWVEGRSLPSDGSALQALDADGVTCHLCHRLTNPDDSEIGVTGVQSAPFVAAGGVCATSDAHEGVGCDLTTGNPCSGGQAACVREGFHGNAMFSIFQDAAAPVDITRLGPYSDPLAPHNAGQSSVQRDAALCGTCHDVSNPVTGDLAPGHGRIGGDLPAGSFSGVPGDAVATKAALRNPPYAYGVEQRTYSEWSASSFSKTLVSSFDILPAELQVAGGVVKAVSDAAAAKGGNYADGTPRRFSCQSCHLMPANAIGCRTANPRADLPLHDLTGANVWAPLAILYLDDATLHGTSRLRLGAGVPDRQAISNGATRAAAMLASAVSLQLTQAPSVLANSVRVVNLAGHKLFTGYPEGRRMWLDVKWYGGGGALIREDGAYGSIAVTDGAPGAPTSVDTLLDPADPHTHVYGVASGISKAWAQKLLAPPLSLPGSTPLAFDRQSGAVLRTLSDAALGTDAVTPSSHLALDDVVLADNRIPPWGMDYAEARKRNALPVPATAYLGAQAPGDGAVYDHFDDVPLEPPIGAVRAAVSLLYQTTSWEYVQFVWKTNARTNPFLASVGDDLLDAWLHTGMAQPVVVATVSVPEPSSASLGSVSLAALLSLRLRTCTRRRPSR